MKLYLTIIFIWLTAPIFSQSHFDVLFDSADKAFNKEFEVTVSHEGLKVTHRHTGVYYNVASYDLKWIPWMQRKVYTIMLNQNKWTIKTK